MATFIKPHKFLDKSYFHAQPKHEDVMRFVMAMKELDNKLQLCDRENQNKTLFMNFLRSACYGEDYVVNELNNVDLTIAKAENREQPFVLIEAKRYGSDEMITDGHFNRKALRQLVYYYICQEASNRNICYLMITDYDRIYIFDKMNFLKLFYEDKKFRNEVLKCKEQNYNTKAIYDDLIKNKIKDVDDKIEYTTISISAIREQLQQLELDEDIAETIYRNCREMRIAYKLLSEIGLQKLPYQIDHNYLNEDFYKELLYVMGLHEVIKKGTAYIERLKKKDRDENSLLEQAIVKVQNHVPSHKNDDLFEDALDLVITWVNRILFVKLLEAQLIKANIIKEKFLTSDKIKSFYELEYLFVRVLGHRELPNEDNYIEKRKEWENKFADVPYLNSSLFDLTSQEKRYVSIDSMYNGELKSPYKHTKLKYKEYRRDGVKRHTLDYILDFLDIYDFGIDATSESTVKHDGKPIINAAVLGRIFEKINGYKDGAFFTPSHISQFMCRDVIRNIVLEKVNSHYDWHCNDFEELAELIAEQDKSVRKEINAIINSISICDPAVGSGHFLVSALNEIITIKYDLGVLEYWEEGKKVNDYDIVIENDELVITDGNGDFFRYIPKDKSSLRLQKTLYEEKRTIIKNCLFGTDLNNKSVEICRLRLWIELLKNIYRENKVLRTLPNIDINIKCGDSLLSRKPIYINRCNVSKDDEDTQAFMCLYKDTANRYKDEDNKKVKAELQKKLNDIIESRLYHPDVDLFGIRSKKQSAIDGAYENGIEWTVVFPELLDTEGRFTGFDAIIGNPPYIAIKNVKESKRTAYGEIKKDKKTKQQKKVYNTYDTDGDIYALFFELGLKLLKEGGTLSYITSNKWLRNQSADVLRGYLSDNSNPIRLINLRGMQLFKNATVETDILTVRKEANQGKCLCVETSKADLKMVKEDLGQLAYDKSRISECDFSTTDNWTILSDFERIIKDKIERNGTLLQDWEGININAGIKTGYNPAFVLDSTQQRDAILADCKSDDERRRTEEIIMPVIAGEDISKYKVEWSGRWLINTHNGIESVAPAVDVNTLPALKKHLDQYYKDFEKRSDQGITPYNLRDCAFLSDLQKDKIVWGELSDKAKFAMGGKEIPLNTVFFMVGDNIDNIIGQLNSKIILWYFHKYRCTYSGNGTARWLKYIVMKLPLIKDLPKVFTEKARRLCNNDADAGLLENEIDEMLYDAYGLDENEKEYLRNYNFNE